jgi:hypothetical protein
MNKRVAVLRREGRADLPVPSESDEQRNLFTWARLTAREVPALKLLHAIPNGGSRGPIEAAIMKAEGIEPGVPDICLPFAPHHAGLYIEMKRSAFAMPVPNPAQWGTITELQLKWLQALNENNYHAVVCRGYLHARETIEAYLASDLAKLDELNRWWKELPAETLKKITRKESAQKSSKPACRSTFKRTARRRRFTPTRH